MTPADQRFGADQAAVGQMQLRLVEQFELAAFRSLRYATVQGAGHMLHHDQPEEVARLIEEFLRA